MPRKLSPYELNELHKYHLKSEDLLSQGNLPVEYLTGHVDFFGLDFLTTRDCLIPRIETERLVEIAIKFLSEKNLDHPHLLDLATGSGCIGISLAHHLQKAGKKFTITLSDISETALTVAKQNIMRLTRCTPHIQTIKSNLFDQIPPQKFDLITANLPYIPSQNIPTLDSSVRDFEPHLALDGGLDGTVLIQSSINQLPDFLSSTGLAIFEIDDSHSLSSFQIPNSLQSNFKPDQYGVNRFLCLTFAK